MKAKFVSSTFVLIISFLSVIASADYYINPGQSLKLGDGSRVTCVTNTLPPFGNDNGRCIANNRNDRNAVNNCNIFLKNEAGCKGIVGHLYCHWE